jgi:hypothetical protein
MHRFKKKGRETDRVRNKREGGTETKERDNKRRRDKKKKTQNSNNNNSKPFSLTGGPGGGVRPGSFSSE